VGRGGTTGLPTVPPPCGRGPDGRGRRDRKVAAALQRLALPERAIGGEVAPDRRIARASRHEVSNPVLLITKEAFYPSNSGGDGEGENRSGEGILLLCP
jgi:hypothetical protein